MYFKFIQDNPHGLPNKKNYSTAYDQAILSCIAFNHQKIQQVCG